MSFQLICVLYTSNQKMKGRCVWVVYLSLPDYMKVRQSNQGVFSGRNTTTIELLTLLSSCFCWCWLMFSRQVGPLFTGSWSGGWSSTVNVCSAGHEFREACLSVTFIVVVNSHQRAKQMWNCICFYLWCELTLALGVTAWFGVFFHEIKCNGMTSFMEFMQRA